MLAELQIKQVLAQPASVGPSLGAQEASMLVWALAVLHELNPAIWTALLDVIAAAPSESLDEVTHIYHLQTRMHANFSDQQQRDYNSDQVTCWLTLSCA